MTVTIRKRPLKTKGRFALYLDFYAHQKQWQENLKLYLEDEKGSPVVKQMNKQTMAIAERVKSERLYHLQNDSFGYKKPEKAYRTFNEYFFELLKERERTGVNFDSWHSVHKHLNQFKPNLCFVDIDDRLLEEFKAHLLSKLKPNSASSYFNIFKGAIHEAFRKRLLRDNPADRVRCIKEVDTRREYLTLEELQKLIESECRYKILKRAFIFSCLTGLRWSDIHNLKWDDIREADGITYISYTQRKTKNAELLPISDDAVKLMGEIGNLKEKVFVGLRYSNYMNAALLMWVAKAGITKHITFHCARHTHAVLLLNNGVDIYTVSKMLGHRELKTTSIYAKVVNETKIKAIRQIPSIF